MYNRSDDAWEALTRAGTEFLVERAQRRRGTSYTELNTVLSSRTGQPPFDFSQPAERAAMGHLLGRIVDATWDPERRLMLSALVHYLDQNNPGPGFYALAAQRGLLPRAASADAKFEFWITQVNRLFELHARPAGSR